MMSIYFETDNAAFEDDKIGETKRILRDVTARLENGANTGIILDVNGNRIGDWSLLSDSR